MSFREFVDDLSPSNPLIQGWATRMHIHEKSTPYY